MGGVISTTADMYSFGVLLHTLASGQLLRHRRERLMPLTGPQDCPEAVVKLMQRCLSFDPCKRPSARQALRAL